MKVLIKKINNWPILTALFSLFLFYIPFQDRYHKSLKMILKRIINPEQLVTHHISYYITDLLMLLMIIFGFRLITMHQFFLRRSINSKFLLSFAAFALISILFSSNKGEIWSYFHFLQLALPIFTFVILSEVLEIEKNIGLFFGIICAAGCIEGIIVIKQYILQHSIGLRGLGEISQHYEFSPCIYMANKCRWIFDHLFHTSSPSRKILRPAGTFPHTNILGGFMGIVQFAIYFLFINTKRKKVQWLLIGVICFQTLVLYLSFSRAAIFGLIGGSCFFLGALFYLKMVKKTLYLLSILFLSHFLTWVILHEQLQKRGGIIEQNAASYASDSGRIYFQKTALSMFKKHPLLGYGWSQYSVKMDKYALEGQGSLQVVHNIYLLVLAETGIFGFIAFLGFIFSSFYQLQKITLDPVLITLISMFIFILFCGLLDHYWLLHQHGRLLFFTIPALISAYIFEKKELLKFQSQSSLIPS